MARQMLVLALIFFAVFISMASAASHAPAASPNAVESPIDNNIIGTLDGTVGGAAPVGGPVPEGAFANLSPESQSSGAATITPQLSTIATVVIYVVVAHSFLF